MRATKDEDRTPNEFLKNLNEKLLREIPGAPEKVSYSTALRWMRFLGFAQVKASKGWFTDGHERDDVVQERKAFLELMETLEPRMRKYADDKVSGKMMKELIPVCTDKEVVMITHDESTFYANQGKKMFWMENGKKKLLPKSDGQSIMVSGFQCFCHGFMSTEIEGNILRSYQIFYAGSNRDGWFTNEDLVEQLHRTAPLFRELHPEATIECYLFFDNSMTHRKKAPDGLDADRLNLKDGGKKRAGPDMRNGWYYKEIDGEMVKISQSMYREDGQQKGMFVFYFARTQASLK